MPGRIQISRATYERVFDLGFEFEERESVFVKGKGVMKTYMLKAKHHMSPLSESATTEPMAQQETEDEPLEVIKTSETTTQE